MSNRERGREVGRGIPYLSGEVGREGRGEGEGKVRYFNNNSSSKTVLGMCIRHKDPRTRVLGLFLACFVEQGRVGQSRAGQSRARIFRKKMRVWGKGREGGLEG